MRLYVVGRIDDAERYHEWEFIGVFDSEELAVAACVSESHCVCPVGLNENVESGIDWPGAWYPLLQDKPEAAQ